jgi:hypothetical protein
MYGMATPAIVLLKLAGALVVGVVVLTVIARLAS